MNAVAFLFATLFVDRFYPLAVSQSVVLLVLLVEVIVHLCMGAGVLCLPAGHAIS